MSTQHQPDLMPSLIPLLSDPAIMEIMIDGYERIYVDQRGKFEDVPTPYRDNDHLMGEISVLAAYSGRRADASNPILDFRLSDNSLVHVVLPPISLTGPVINIRKFGGTILSFDELLRYEVITENMVAFLKACVKSRLNIVICGGIGSGKTTMLNVMAREIPDNERIITMGPVAELQLNQKYLITLEARQPDLEGKGAVTVRDLVRSSMKMRPDRLIVNDVLGPEILDLLQAMHTGYDGTIISLHAQSVRDALSRLEVMATIGNPSMPLLAIREQMAQAFNVIIYQERLPGGIRRIMKITAVQGMQGDMMMLDDLFEFRQTGIIDGKMTGYLTATGQVPRFLSRMQAANVDLSMDVFKPR